MSARYFRIVIAVFVALGMLSGATAAFADPDYPPPVDPDEVPVEPEAPEEPGVEERPDPVPPPDEVVEDEVAVIGVDLPRTGTSVTLLAVLGAALIGLGALLIARRRSPSEPA